MKVQASSESMLSGDGPWRTEPDRVDWTDAATSLRCLIARNDFEVFCGYVCVPTGHQLHGVPWDHCSLKRDPCWSSYASLPISCAHSPSMMVDVHGGLDFSGPAGDGWWFGFHCGHAIDLTPEHVRRGWSRPDAQYRNLAYVSEEVRVLAQQLARL